MSKYYDMLIENNKKDLESALLLLKKEIAQNGNEKHLELELKNISIIYNEHLLAISIKTMQNRKIIPISFYWYDLSHVLKDTGIENKLPEKITAVKLKNALGAIYIFSQDSEEVNVEFYHEDEKKSNFITQHRNYYSFSNGNFSSSESEELPKGFSLLSTINKIAKQIGIKNYKEELQDLLFLGKPLSTETKEMLKITADVFEEDYFVAQLYKINIEDLSLKNKNNKIVNRI